MRFARRRDAMSCWRNFTKGDDRERRRVDFRNKLGLNFPLQRTCMEVLPRIPQNKATAAKKSLGMVGRIAQNVAVIAGNYLTFGRLVPNLSVVEQCGVTWRDAAVTRCRQSSPLPPMTWAWKRQAGGLHRTVALTSRSAQRGNACWPQSTGASIRSAAEVTGRTLSIGVVIAPS